MTAVLLLLLTAGSTRVWAEEYSFRRNSSGTEFLYDEQGKKVTRGGWYEVEGNRYFIYNTSGRKGLGWITWAGGKYYTNPKTGIQVMGLVNLKGRNYYFSPLNKSPGKMATGWRTIGGKRYYFLKSGARKESGWLTVDGKKYYFEQDASQTYGFRTLGSYRYYFDKKAGGAMKKNSWLKYGGKLYYFLSTGKMAAGGWKYIGGDRCYFDADGAACTGTRIIGGVLCTFGSDGILKNGGKASFSLYSECAGIYEVSTGRPVYVKNPNLRHSNASTTKIMTCLLTLEKGGLDSIVTASRNAAVQEPTKIWLTEGERFRVEDLLYALMLPSANDAAVALAEYVSGNVPAFVQLMNARAAGLGCRNTVFATPNGLDRGYTHYTTVSDLARITIQALKNPTFRKIFGTARYSFMSSGEYYSVATTNRLLGNLPGVTGGKTGFTNKAGQCFVGLVRAKSGKEYIAVTLGAPYSEARWSDATRLLTYAYNLG